MPKNNKKKKSNILLPIIIVLIVVIIIGIIVWGFMANWWSSKNNNSSENCIDNDFTSLIMGTLLPETGALEFLGPPLTNAVELAIDDINDAGGVNGEDVILKYGDSGTDPEIANDTVDRLISCDGVNAIIGAAASGITKSVLDKIEENKIILCAPSNTVVGLGKGNSYYFRTAPPDNLQVQTLAKLVIGDGHKNVAIITRGDDYGKTFNIELKSVIEKLGGTIVYNTPYQIETSDFQSILADVAASNADAVVLVSFEEGYQILQEMIEQNLFFILSTYITSSMSTPELGSYVDEKNPGIVSGIKGTQVNANPNIDPTFTQRFKAIYEMEPLYASYAYDCAIMIALAAESAKSNKSEDIAKHMNRIFNGKYKCNTFAEGKQLLSQGVSIKYQGVSGPINLVDGHPTVGIYNIYEYNNKGIQQFVQTVASNSPIKNKKLATATATNK